MTKEIAMFYPESQKEWRQWLEKNHELEQAVWLVQYKKNADKPSISWSEAVDEALCFGWIDSTRKTLDEERYIQFFTRRKPGSIWSKINKDKIEKLIECGKMRPAGLKTIDIAKKNGQWTLLDEVETLAVPKDLAKAFRKNKGSEKYFLGLSKSVKKSILQWVVLAKRPETRQKRIDEIASLAAQNLKPAQF